MGKWAIFFVIFLAFVAYVAWMVGPYLRSVIVRDAAVTTWSRAAVAPITGRIVTRLPDVGKTIGGAEHVATIRNGLLFQEVNAVEETRDRVILSETRIAEAKEYLADLGELERQRIAVKNRSAEAFHTLLETEMTTLRHKIAVNANRIEVLQRIAGRQQNLVDRGVGSKAKLDESLLRVADMVLRQAELEATLKSTQLRDRLADDNVYITREGHTPEWLRSGKLELQLEQRRARHDLHSAETALREAHKDLAIQQKALVALSEAKVNVPSGSMVFSVIAAPNATVSPGDRIIEWIDCTELMVDVPVSDAELPLILLGTRADVALEGESDVRQATVLMTRGSSATLGRADLVAIAKGRTTGVAQVLLSLDAQLSEFDHCPVGRAAYVEFPGVGLIDILRARLRL